MVFYFSYFTSSRVPFASVLMSNALEGSIAAAEAKERFTRRKKVDMFNIFEAGDKINYVGIHPQRPQ
jgi:hypothetical protein